MVVTPEQRHESTQLASVLDAIRVAHPESHPHRGPEHLIADGGYSYPGCRLLLRRRRILDAHPRAARPTPVAAGTTGGLRQGNLPAAQRGEEVSQPTQAVARGGYAIREAGGQLPGDGGHRRADDLVVLMNHQTRPSPKASVLLNQLPLRLPIWSRANEPKPAPVDCYCKLLNVTRRSAKPVLQPLIDLSKTSWQTTPCNSPRNASLKEMASHPCARTWRELGATSGASAPWERSAS